MSKIIPSFKSTTITCDTATIGGNITAGTVNGVSVAASVVPSMRMVGYDQKGLAKYVDDISDIYTESYVIAYTHGATAVQFGYNGGVYSPIQNRIYLMPSAQSNQTNWHYINCDTGAVVAYAHGATVLQFGYNGGVYSPTQNRIYLVPYSQANQASWHYINCESGAVVAYTHGATVLQYGYNGGIYLPTQSRIYMVPDAQSNQASWHYIQDLSNRPVSKSLMAGPLFNKL